MKKFTYPLSLLLVTGFLFSCNSNRNATRSQSFANNNEKDTAKVVQAKNKEEECVNPNQEVTSAPGNSNKDLTNIGGYNYSYTESRTDFEGASGAGTGSSYASNYYGSSKRKSKEKVCTVKDSVQTVRPDIEHDNQNFFTSNEEADTLLQEDLNEEWDPSKSGEEFWGASDTTETQDDWGYESNNGQTEEEEEEENNYENLSW